MSSPHTPSAVRHWAIVPAAGVGQRMQAACPKQYLSLAGKSLLRHSLERLHDQPWIDSILLAIHPDDEHFHESMVSDLERVSVIHGGDERAYTVLAGLQTLAASAAAQDWVLVHDAARPCLTAADLLALRQQLEDDAVGGLLATPVRDTLKRIDPAGRVEHTVPRQGLWAAATPQMFRFALLQQALSQALAQCDIVTDEASALELAGQAPRIVQGRSDNLKITVPADLALAEAILQAQQSEQHS